MQPTLRLPFHAACLTAALLLAAPASAQLYKWVGPDGKVTYSDVPPPPNAAKVEKKSYDSAAPAANFPEDLAAAVAANPVTLYTADGCAPCNDGRKYLKAQGVPFAEKTVNTSTDVEKLRQLSGDTQLPLLRIATSNFRGFSNQEWRAALSQAGYPASNRLPPDYRYPAAEPAAPPPPEKRAGENGQSKPLPQPKKPRPEASFQF